MPSRARASIAGGKLLAWADMSSSSSRSAVIRSICTVSRGRCLGLRDRDIFLAVRRVLALTPGKAITIPPMLHPPKRGIWYNSLKKIEIRPVAILWLSFCVAQTSRSSRFVTLRRNLLRHRANARLRPANRDLASLPQVRRNAQARRAVWAVPVRLQRLRHARRDKGPRRSARRVCRGHADCGVLRFTEESVEGDALVLSAPAAFARLRQPTRIKCSSCRARANPHCPQHSRHHVGQIPR